MQRTPERPDLVLKELRDVYESGGNMMEHMRSRRSSADNETEAILLSYDLQAGAYVKAMSNPAFAELKANTGQKLGGIIRELGALSVCEAGVGEATTLREVASHLDPETAVAGFDISLSRLAHARGWLKKNKARDVFLFAAEMLRIPLATSAMDVVYTFHSLEPNGGQERPLLAELLRVAKRYVVLVEPSSDLGSDATRARMAQHGYVQDLRRHLDEMGAKVVRHELWGLDGNPTNQAALTIIEREASAPVSRDFQLASPLGGAPLELRDGYVYCPSEGFAFPIIDGFPCLRPRHAIVAARIDDVRP